MAPVLLSPREERVLRAIADGMTTREIAALLGVQYETANTAIDRIKDKLGLRRITQLAAWSARNLDRV